MLRHISIVLLATSATVFSACGSDRTIGCDADAQCAEGRFCNLETDSCETSPGFEEDGRIQLSEVSDPPEQVRGPVQADAEDFLGTWQLSGNGQRRDSGGTAYQYDEQWVMVVELGQGDHDLSVTFPISTQQALSEDCRLDADLSGGGFLLRSGPCRGGSDRMDRFTGTAYIDEFDMLSVELLGEGRNLTTNGEFVTDYFAYGERSEEPQIPSSTSQLLDET